MAVKFDEEWLYRIEEPALDPDRRIIDPHMHIWTEKFQLYIDHFGKAAPEDFLRGIAQSGHNVVATVHLTIQANYRDDLPQEMLPVAETEFLEGVANALEEQGLGTPQLAAGIVAGVDMLMGRGIEPVLDAHAAASSRLRGVRHPLAWHPSPLIPFKEEHPELLLRPEMIEAAKVLAQRDLSFDAFVFYNQLPEIVALARAVPDLRIILNHLGGPLTDPRFDDEAEEIFAQWKAGMRVVGECENVVVKLGGMGMLPTAADYWTRHPLPPTSEQHAAWIRPYVMHALECFSVERAMFQSNFPTEKPSANYGIVWNSFKRIAAAFSEAENSKLFFENAKRAYKLDQIPSA